MSMVYYGRLSQGCERCRQLKIKVCSFQHQVYMFSDNMITEILSSVTSESRNA